MGDLIPVPVTLTAADDGIFYLSNDPYFASISLLLHFDGNSVDSSKYRNTVTNNLSVTATTPKFGTGSLAQTGTSAPGPTCGLPVVQNGPLDILSGTADFTVDGWFWLTTGGFSGSMTIFDLMGDGTTFSDPYNAYLQAYSTTGSNVGLQLVTAIQPPASLVWKNFNEIRAGGVGAWHHFALVRSNGVPMLFMDGTSVTVGGGLNWINYPYPPGTFAPRINLGNTGSVNGGSLTGKIDEFRVTKGVARWTSNFTPPTAPVDAIPVRRGYNDGTLPPALTFGSTNPNPPLVDDDTLSYTQDYVTGTFAAPVYQFQVAITGQDNSPNANDQMFQSDLAGVSFTDKDGVAQVFDGADATFQGVNNYGIWTWPTSKLMFAAGGTYNISYLFEDPNVDFNCACENVSSYATLAELRIRMAIQCGYAAMSANLPPGQIAEFNEYLRTAQNQLYYKFRAQRTERFFRWKMEPGQRYYGINASAGTCDVTLDPLAISWVGFEDLNRAWYRLVKGIDPVYYTRANINFGWPTRYEIRQCIEVFPAPQAAYTLWIKGDIGLAPFTADSDRPTFDDEAILLFAVANWKTAKGKPGAEVAMGQATQRIQDLTARKHGTARYVPSTYIQNPATPPKFLPLGNQQS